MFTLEDACQVVDWAANTDWVRITSFWSINRDNFDGTTVTSPKSSGIPQVGFTLSCLYHQGFYEQAVTDASTGRAAGTHLVGALHCGVKGWLAAFHLHKQCLQHGHSHRQAMFVKLA